VVSVTCGGSGGVTAQVVFEIAQGTESTSPGKKFMLCRRLDSSSCPYQVVYGYDSLTASDDFV
jgi:hypothetical protein